MQVSTDIQKEVVEEIKVALSPIPLDDRLGFLFGLVVGSLRNQGMSIDGIRKEVAKGLELALSELDN